MINYKGYIGKAEYDDDAGIFHGEVVGIRDVVTFQGTSVKELKHSFRASIDDYIRFCKKIGKNPEMASSGKLALRMPPELHAKVAVLAKIEGKSLNAWVNDAVKYKISCEARI